MNSREEMLTHALSNSTWACVVSERKGSKADQLDLVLPVWKEDKTKPLSFSLWEHTPANEVIADKDIWDSGRVQFLILNNIILWLTVHKKLLKCFSVCSMPVVLYVCLNLHWVGSLGLLLKWMKASLLHPDQLTADTIIIWVAAHVLALKCNCN